MPGYPPTFEDGILDSAEWLAEKMDMPTLGDELLKYFGLKPRRIKDGA